MLMYTHRARVAVTASSLSALVAAVAATPLSAHQAEIQTVILRRPAAELPEPFSRVTGLAEFSDGRLAVTDPVERLVA
ncbi:MAG: hypothetical protein GWN79_11660, partial [Actinobacteria bacterium]|nr:hypothetical protein [Actinomycetota bacterium]NIU19703.1 hypothetical protein [Actinomycetota bacterium]NIU67100.1 hypothetical protein [Actinomycetota bacterium]NIV87656.1 hypothetical protein [Actinomycetota bacterium]NIX21375.1 hypothetical protein [Actinomycetota bacterium]